MEDSDKEPLVVLRFAQGEATPEMVAALCRAYGPVQVVNSTAWLPPDAMSLVNPMIEEQAQRGTRVVAVEAYGTPVVFALFLPLKRQGIDLLQAHRQDELGIPGSGRFIAYGRIDDVKVKTKTKRIS